MSRLTSPLIIASLLTAAAMPVSADSILFGRVGSTSYVADGQDLVNYLSAGGHTVNYVDLNTTVISDFSIYDQVWVYDLVTGANDSANQLANYNNISNWYNNVAPQNLILDGRIISSSGRWTSRPNGLGDAGGEPEWIQNYANVLSSVGGGLVLGTDHADVDKDTGVFVDGINRIADGIGVDRFRDFFFEIPFEALVDVNSQLYVSALEQCASDPASQCINDNSSTSFVATGAQDNGQFLTPVAYHGTTSQAFDQAAVSATFRSPTFPAPAPSVLALMGIGLFGIGVARKLKK